MSVYVMQIFARYDLVSFIMGEAGLTATNHICYVFYHL